MTRTMSFVQPLIYRESYESGTVIASSSLTAPVSPPKSSLGKRRRDLDRSGNATGADSEQDGKSPRKALRPPRKKTKLNPGDIEIASDPESDAASDEDQASLGDDVETAQPIRRAPAFTVFSGPEEPPEPSEASDGGPPTTHLSDLFGSTATTPPNGVTPSVPTSTAYGAENRVPATGNAFSITFANSIFRPMTSSRINLCGSFTCWIRTLFPSLVKIRTNLD